MAMFGGTSEQREFLENSDKVILCAAALQDGELQRYLEVSQGTPLMFELTHAKKVSPKPSTANRTEALANSCEPATVTGVLGSASDVASAPSSGGSSDYSSTKKKKRNRKRSRRRRSKGSKGNNSCKENVKEDGSNEEAFEMASGKVSVGVEGVQGQDIGEKRSEGAEGSGSGTRRKDGRAKTKAATANLIKAESPWKPVVETSVANGPVRTTPAAASVQPRSFANSNTANVITPVGKMRESVNAATPTGAFVLKTSCGVLEFSGEGRDTAFLPRWMMQALLAEEGDRIHFKLRKFKPVSYIKLKPVGYGFAFVRESRNRKFLCSCAR